MSLNISEKTMSLIVQYYLSPLVLFTKIVTRDATISLLKKMKFESWPFDYSGFGLKIILFEWVK